MLKSLLNPWGKENMFKSLLNPLGKAKYIKVYNSPGKW